MTPMRLTVVLTHPIQYYAPWFRHIERHAPEIALTVVHATEPTPAQQGVGFDRAFEWDVPLTEGYRSLKLGKVVGEPTAGWIIFTSAISLVDGTTFRLPAWTVRTASGAPMERHPRPVDVTVQRQVGSSEDAQLAAAVRTLLETAR